MSVNQVVVWEWQDGSGYYMPYSADISNLLENCFMKGDNSVMHNDIIVHFGTMQQHNTTTNEMCAVQRLFHPKATVFGTGFQWEYRGNVSWEPYSTVCAALIEDAYSKHIPNVDLRVLCPNMPYTVDLSTMTQMRIDTRMTRQIRRRYVGGYLDAPLHSQPIHGPPHNNRPRLFNQPPMAQMATRVLMQPMQVYGLPAPFTGMMGGALPVSSQNGTQGPPPSKMTRTQAPLLTSHTTFQPILPAAAPRTQTATSMGLGQGQLAPPPQAQMPPPSHAQLPPFSL